MDISSAIVNIYKIEQMKISDYEQLVENNSSRYRVKLDTRSRGVLVQDLFNPKNMIMLRCIREYYSTTDTKQIFTNESCSYISKTLIDDDFNTNGCIDCHRNCCRKLKSNKLVRLKNKE